MREVFYLKVNSSIYVGWGKHVVFPQKMLVKKENFPGTFLRENNVK